jgi:hypothetical protein
MGSSSVQSSEVILVLCHSFFHDAFRVQKPVTPDLFRNWLSSRFVANLIIERQAELSEGSTFAVTSLQAFTTFALKFHGDKPSYRQKELVEILSNSICVIDAPSVTKLSVDDSVLVICDTLYSRSKYTPILVTSIPKKREKAEEFYRKKEPDAKIPYQIYTPAEAEIYLRGSFPELAALVEKRMKMFLTSL